jgi:hypothetical protein
VGVAGSLFARQKSDGGRQEGAGCRSAEGHLAGYRGWHERCQIKPHSCIDPGYHRHRVRRAIDVVATRGLDPAPNRPLVDAIMDDVRGTFLNWQTWKSITHGGLQVLGRRLARRSFAHAKGAHLGSAGRSRFGSDLFKGTDRGRSDVWLFRPAIPA